MPILFHAAVRPARKTTRKVQTPESRSSSEGAHSPRSGSPRRHYDDEEEHESPDDDDPPSPSSSSRSTTSGSVSPTDDRGRDSPAPHAPPAKPATLLSWAHREKGPESGPHIAWDPRRPPRGGSTAVPGGDDADDPDFCPPPPQRARTFKMRAFEDDEGVDWWFASTACPLLAAATVPLANVLSIAALVTPWRVDLSDGFGGTVPDFAGIPYPDPTW
jgi:hypothetical protein